jgi:hypothetical protein
MLKAILTSAFVVTAGSQPSAASASAAAGANAPQESEANAPQESGANAPQESGANAPQELAASAPSLAGDASSRLAAEFAARFGAPTSRRFLALDARQREAVERFFVHGPGAVPRGGSVDATASASTGAAGAHSPGHGLVQGDPVPGYPGLYNMTLGGTGSGYLEYFLLQVPDGPPSGPTPLLVVYHKYGVSHGDALFHTNFVQEARNRGWYLVAPLGAVDDNFGSLPSQINTQAVLDWTRNWFPVDRTRIYGVGFSMGGGWCTSYAARHLDPNGAEFAAVVDHTGTVSLGDAYANEAGNTMVIQELENLFGGSPTAQPFNYQRCSSVDIDPMTHVVGAGTDMARNLPVVRCWMANNDPQPYLPEQTQVFFDHIQPMNRNDVFTIVHASGHTWDTLDDTAVCDWLSTYTLIDPSIGNTLADLGGAWHHFQIDQEVGGAFTPFSWFADANANRISFWGTANLQRISVDSPALGLAYSGNLRLNMSSADGTGDQVLFLHVPHAPLTVTRNGVPASGTYDALTQTFLVDETSGSGSQWVLGF